MKAAGGGTTFVLLQAIIGWCIDDPSLASSDASCPLQVKVRLLQDGTHLDRSTIGPVSMLPGENNTVAPSLSALSPSVQADPASAVATTSADLNGSVLGVVKLRIEPNEVTVPAYDATIRRQYLVSPAKPGMPLNP